MLHLTTKKNISDKGIEHLKALEGERLKVYLDSANILTVGVGHKVLEKDALKYGDVISQFRSSKFLRDDLNTAKNAVRDTIKTPLNQNQFDALVSFAFNVGADAFKNSTMAKKLNVYDYNGALEQFTRWVYSTNAKTGIKSVDNVLVRRRKLEQNLFNT